MIDPRNYIPGCASYTKASEISSLQKYLKKGIKKRDEALKTPEKPEELHQDPTIPGITELPKGTVGIHDPREVIELPDKSLKIVNPREESLDDRRENIKGAETPDLPETAIGLTDDREAALESRREDLSGIQEITELPGERLDINETIIPELPEEVVTAPGEISELESLVDTKEVLEGDPKEPGALDKTKLKTPSSETNNKVTKLSKTVIDGPKVSKTKVSLEDHREDLGDKRKVALETHKETIEDKNNLKLSDHLETISDKQEVALEHYREGLEDKRNIALETKKETLDDDRDSSLETHKDTLEDKRNIDLDNTQLKAPGKQKTPELSGTVISGPEVKEVGLEKSKVGLEDKRNVVLETKRDEIEDKRNPSLSDQVEKITDKRSPELPGTVIGLSDKRNVALENHKDTIKNPKDPELSKARENLDVPEVSDLRKSSVSLKANSDVNLEDHSEKLSGTKDISKLPEDSQKILGETKDVSLPEDSEKIIGEVRDPELNSTKITRPGQNKEVSLPSGSENLRGATKVDSLETTRLDLEDDREMILPEGATLIEGEIPEIESLGDSSIERPGETPNLDEIYANAENSGDLFQIKALDVTLPDIRLDITDDREPFLEDEKLPMEPNASEPGWNGELVTIEDIKAEPDDNWTVESDKNPVGWDGELVTTEDIKSEPDDNWTIESDKNPKGWDESLVTIEDIKSETDDNWTVEPDQNPEGWNGELVTTDDIKAEPNDNWTVEPDQNPEGWDGDLVTTEDIKAETDDNWTIEPDKNPEGWNEALVTIDDIIAEPEDNWTIEPDQNPEGWDGELVTVNDIKAEPEDNWTVEPDLNPEGWDETLVTTDDIKAEPDDNWTVEADKNEIGWNESLEDKRLDITNINDILGLETEVIKVTPHITEAPMDPDHAQKFVDISYNHSFDQNSDGVSSSIVSTFSDESMTSLEAYGKATETPESRPDHMDPEVTDNPRWEHIDTPSMSQGDFNNYNKSVKITPYKVEESSDPDHAQKFVDTSYNHSFKKDSDGVSSSIESNFSDGTIIGLKEYGEETKTPEIRPDHKNPEITEDPKWSHIETTTMETRDFVEYNESSTRVVQDTREHMRDPEKVESTLKEAFEWSEEHMGRHGWNPQKLAIPAYKLGGSFTSYLNPSKYLRWTVENTVGAIPFKGSLKQWILNEALAGLLAARDKLEKELSLQPYRLPGEDEYAIQLLRQGMSGVDLGDVKNVVNNAAANLSSSGQIIKNPINRPGKNDKTKGGQEYRWEGKTGFESKDGPNVADSVLIEDYAEREAKAEAKRAKEESTKALGSNQGLKDYIPSYLSYTGSNDASCASNDFGLVGTLNNLARQGITKLKSFDQLKDALENSPYATTSSRFYGKSSGPVHRHDNAMTLDSNHVWEIIFEPYLGIENGDKSFLPSIQQINYENYHGFGINTNWDTWIPFTSFELNSRKMVQKNLSLYSGEISIPQNLEFTNELRLVICDDQYKSWKRYFNMVMYASTYLCEVHDRDYYTKKALKSLGTFIDTFGPNQVVDYYRGVVRPAPYKNLTFRCKILSMNPQFQTVNVSDLLVVLKDFTEEWQGEVDSSPTELALMFSVVGENPSGKHMEEKPRTVSSAVGPITVDDATLSMVSGTPGTTITS